MRNRRVSRRDKPELKETREDPRSTGAFQKIRELLRESGNVTAGQQAAVLTRFAGRLAGQSGFSRSFSSGIYREGYQSGRTARMDAQELKERTTEAQKVIEAPKLEEPAKA